MKWDTRRDMTSQFQVGLTATTAKAMVVVPTRGGKGGRKRKWHLDMLVLYGFAMCHGRAVQLEGDSDYNISGRTCATMLQFRSSQVRYF